MGIVPRARLLSYFPHLLVLVFGLWIIAGQLWSLVYLPEKPFFAKELASPSTGVLVQRHLFGEAPAATLSVAPQSSVLAKFQLLGVVINGSASMAILRASAGPSKVLRLGDELEDGVRLKSVSHFGVILSLGERDFELVLPRKMVNGQMPLEKNVGTM